jgi:hypothetical protein
MITRSYVPAEGDTLGPALLNKELDHFAAQINALMANADGKADWTFAAGKGPIYRDRHQCTTNSTVPGTNTFGKWVYLDDNSSADNNMSIMGNAVDANGNSPVGNANWYLHPLPANNAATLANAKAIELDVWIRCQNAMGLYNPGNTAGGATANGVITFREVDGEAANYNLLAGIAPGKPHYSAPTRALTAGAAGGAPLTAIWNHLGIIVLRIATSSPKIWIHVGAGVGASDQCELSLHTLGYAL